MSTTSSRTPSTVEYSWTTPVICASVGRVADHRRQQDATQRVAERVAVAALERFHRDDGRVRANRLDLDRARLE